MSMADTIKCPNCAANLVFEPSSGKLECAFCGGSFDPASFESVVEELTAEPVKKAEDTMLQSLLRQQKMTIRRISLRMMRKITCSSFVRVVQAR